MAGTTSNRYGAIDRLDCAGRTRRGPGAMQPSERRISAPSPPAMPWAPLWTRGPMGCGKPPVSESDSNRPGCGRPSTRAPHDLYHDQTTHQPHAQVLEQNEAACGPMARHLALPHSAPVPRRNMGRDSNLYKRGSLPRLQGACPRPAPRHGYCGWESTTAGVWRLPPLAP